MKNGPKSTNPHFPEKRKYLYFYAPKYEKGDRPQAKLPLGWDVKK